MINFRRDGTRIVASIECPKSTVEKRWLEFEYRTNCELTADVARTILSEALIGKLSKIREEAYAKGYKDAKAKRGKVKWFSGWW